jgi:NTP pyrophosphatase (non-canonical NTP hydrolase)
VDHQKSNHQENIRNWVETRLGANAMQPKERALRMLEEAFELAQCCGIFEGQANLLMRHVYSKPVGDLHRELGGVMLTTLALAEAFEISAENAMEEELLRINSLPKERFVNRQIKNAKDGIGALPE